MRAIRTALIHGVYISLLLMAAPAVTMAEELVMKMLVVNPSETETKEFSIRSPLPPEIKPEHVLEADGLTVDYDSQAGTYVLVGKVSLKPKAALSKQIVLEDVWVIPPDRFAVVREEIDSVLAKLIGSAYRDQGRLVADAVTRQLETIEASQRQPIVNPEQHISLYRDNLKALQSVESEMVSLRQLMVMAALQPLRSSAALQGTGAGREGAIQDRGGLSILTTWKIIFIVLGLLGVVSLSFFLRWQRQLKLQLAKQAADTDREQPSSNGGDLLTAANGGTLPVSPGAPGPPS
jgi:hypothetical protein